MFRLLLLSTAAAALLSAPARACEADTADTAANAGEHLRVLYNGYFFGMRVMKASLDVDLDGCGYEAASVFRTAGLAGFFKDSEIHADSSGGRADTGLAPLWYEHQNVASKKNRRIRIDFTDDDVVSTVTPAFGSMGQPPATQDERFGALDPISSFLQIAVHGGDTPCDRTVPVFDGKQRYDLRFERVATKDIDVRGYEGRTIKCHVYYVPISGFDPEDLAEPETYDKPIEIWLADTGSGVRVPVRFRANVSGLGVRVDVKSIERTPLDAQSALAIGSADQG